MESLLLKFNSLFISIVRAFINFKIIVHFTIFLARSRKIGKVTRNDVLIPTGVAASFW